VGTVAAGVADSSAEESEPAATQTLHHAAAESAILSAKKNSQLCVCDMHVSLRYRVQLYDLLVIPRRAAPLEHILAMDLCGWRPGSEVSVLDADALQRLRSADKRSLASLIDQLGERSARAQGLGAVITTYDKLLATRGSQRLYIVADLSKRLALGMLKVGAKKLFIRTVSGAVKEIEPLCCLDFYVHESLQRQGVGKRLFARMLRGEGTSAAQLAYDRPSSKLLPFLARHYGLSRYVSQPNNYVVFAQYFDGRPPSAARRHESISNRPLTRERRRAASRRPPRDGSERPSEQSSSSGSAARGTASMVAAPWHQQHQQQPRGGGGSNGAAPLDPISTSAQNLDRAWTPVEVKQYQALPPWASLGQATTAHRGKGGYGNYSGGGGGQQQQQQHESERGFTRFLRDNPTAAQAESRYLRPSPCHGGRHVAQQQQQQHHHHPYHGALAPPPPHRGPLGMSFEPATQDTAHGGGAGQPPPHTQLRSLDALDSFRLKVCGAWVAVLLGWWPARLG
jgi:GNAT superfamily N-acetyltransferase